MHRGAEKVTVVLWLDRYTSSECTPEVLGALVGDMAEVDWSRANHLGRGKVSVKFKTAKDADFFRKLCKESGWKVENLS